MPGTYPKVSPGGLWGRLCNHNLMRFSITQGKRNQPSGRKGAQKRGPAGFAGGADARPTENKGRNQKVQSPVVGNKRADLQAQQPRRLGPAARKCTREDNLG